jgi:hypothetical protein
MSGWTHRKRRAGEGSSASTVLKRLEAEVSFLTGRLQRLVSPSMPEGGFLLQRGGQEYQRAINWCWAGDFSDYRSEVLSANPDLEEFLHERTMNAYQAHHLADEDTVQARSMRLNFTGGLISRNRNVHYLPKHQLLLALQSKQKLMNERLWYDFSNVRVMPSYNWTDTFVNDALLTPRPLQYDILDGITACVFDNYTDQMNYSAAHNADTQGQRIDMTNWATLYLPKSSVPEASVSLLGGGNPLTALFRPGFDKLSVVDLFHPSHPDITSNQRRRWNDSFMALQAGTFFDRPNYQPPVAHDLYYHDPIEGRLQSSYVDVEAELDIMRSDPKHKHSWFVMVGGDGLAIHRINHTLARKPGLYLRTAPAVIPVQGEHPHGTCHVLHMGWRPYAPMMLPILHAIGHTECKADFTVSAFNDYDHATAILTEGIAKYFILLNQSGGMPPLSNSTAVLNACSANIDLEWLSHYLHDYAFLYWDLRQAVRGNDSERIDMTWRESVSFMHTDESHKTQYAPMAILRIFWSEALHPALANIYHKNRTVSLHGLKGSNVGWDMPIEKENLMISNNVVRASFDAITKYVRQLNFLGPANRAIEKLVFANRTPTPAKRKKIDEDVQAVVDFLVKLLGGTWAQASQPRAQKDSLLVNPPKSIRPWLSVQRLGQSRAFLDWVQSHIRSKVTWM